MAPNSFSMTAIFLPWFSVRIRFSSVVLPDPRKPVMTVIGTRSSTAPPAAAIAAAAVGWGRGRVEEKQVGAVSLSIERRRDEISDRLALTDSTDSDLIHRT